MTYEKTPTNPVKNIDQINIMVNKTFPITADIRSIMIGVNWQNRQNIKFTFPKEIETTMCFVSLLVFFIAILNLL